MNLLPYKGKAVGLILASNIPAFRVIVVEESEQGYTAVGIVKDNDTTGHISDASNYAWTDEFRHIVSLSELQIVNPQGWAEFKSQYPEIAEKMESADNPAAAHGFW